MSSSLNSLAASRQVDGVLNQRLRAAAQITDDQDVYFRPFVEFNFNEIFAGTIQESGAGPLDLVAGSSKQVLATAGVGWEAGCGRSWTWCSSTRCLAGVRS